MSVRWRKKTAVSIVEYMALIIIIAGALIVMGPYFIRGFNGNWKKSGESFGLGRQYRGNSVECEYAATSSNTGFWYDATCYQGGVTACLVGNQVCEDGVKTGCITDLCTNQ